MIAISSIQTLPATPSHASGYKCAKPLLHPLTHPLFSYCVQLHCWAFQLILRLSQCRTQPEGERERVLLNMSSLNKNAPSIDFVFMQWCHSFQLGWHEGLRVREFSRFFPPLISLSFLYTCSMCGMDVQCTHIGWLFLSVSFIIWTADTGKMLVTFSPFDALRIQLSWWLLSGVLEGRSNTLAQSHIMHMSVDKHSSASEAQCTKKIHGSTIVLRTWYHGNFAVLLYVPLSTKYLDKH